MRGFPLRWERRAGRKGWIYCIKIGTFCHVEPIQLKYHKRRSHNTNPINLITHSLLALFSTYHIPPCRNSTFPFPLSSAPSLSVPSNTHEYPTFRTYPEMSFTCPSLPSPSSPIWSSEFAIEHGGTWSAWFADVSSRSWATSGGCRCIIIRFWRILF